ncbi:MAG: hypothetical protein M1833_005650 [Piccolia ochrophora]|nr:MAG: hypothetical protein M1833_005650 [Piccolia ochrophora]
MTSPPRNLRALFALSEQQRKRLDSALETSSPAYQQDLETAIATLEDCRKLAAEVSIFSDNEDIDDVSSADLPYFLIEYHLADLLLRNNVRDRAEVLRGDRACYERFLNRAQSYGLLSSGDRKLYERYTQAPDSFSTAAATDPASRRDAKIARFRDEKSLNQKLEYLQQNSQALRNDDAALRDLHLTNLQLSIARALSSLDSIARELDILSNVPEPSVDGHSTASQDDRRMNGSSQNEYSDRLDRPISELMSSRMGGPILNKDGRPLQPFTLLDSRDRLRQGVFRPGHSLPTMTIDEYLEEERRRGGIIEGGGEESGRQPEPDEDNLDTADQDTLKAREWDEFVESNPKGSGNTMNRG